MADIVWLCAQIQSLTLSEAAELKILIERQLGLAPGPNRDFIIWDPIDLNETEPPEYSVFLLSAGKSKLNVIKVLRRFSILPIVDAKKLVESAPCTAIQGLAKEDAERIGREFVYEGAEVDIRKESLLSESARTSYRNERVFE